MQTTVDPAAVKTRLDGVCATTGASSPAPGSWPA